MKNIFRISLLVMILSSVYVSCKTDKSTKPSSTGNPNEIIIVAQDNLWKTSLSDTVKSFFSSFRPGLPQPEPLFKVVQIEVSEFSRLFETHRNILIISIDSSLKEAKFESAYNVWARPQRVVKISAPTIELLKTAFTEHDRDIFNLYENAEIERLQALFSKSLNIKAIETIKKKFNISMNIPAGYYIAANQNNFLWIRKEANNFGQGLLIYSYPYTDTNAYNVRKIISVRNQFTRLYVPGPSDSSYMIVSTDTIMKPVPRVLELKKELAVETRGLWDVEGDFMGGPFINYTLVDRKNNMVLTMDGYVYAPNQNKAALVKEVQSILLTFEFIEK
ncbi:MAG TPA: DUF4837 family protein [Lentimicrobium sp.]|nr:DUF4837 family protein [Lentimicrobium sp.]